MGLLGTLGDIAGGVVGLGASIYGGIEAGKARKKMEQYLNQQDAENKAWYNENALSDYTQRADTQNLMRQLRNTLDRQNQISSDTAVVTGATPEQQAVQKQQSDNVIADTYGNIGSLGQQYKDQVTNQYLSMKNNLANQRIGMMNQSANSYENLMNNGMLGVTDSIKSLMK
ncbi:MAG: hypothetical protein FWD60_08685 [Candidatus Azobacteroides sp.]|nr:hypothetical protein [Candidatus Azobacteroides sp.]